MNSNLRFYSDNEIQNAISKAIHEFSWPPTLCEFIKLCDDCSEFTPPDDAFLIACRSNYEELDLVTKVALTNTGRYELKNHDANKYKNKFVDNYKKAVLDYRKGVNIGKNLPQNNTSDYNKKAKEAPKEFSASYLEKCRQTLKG